MIFGIKLTLLLLWLAFSCFPQDFGKIDKLPDWISIDRDVPYGQYKENVIDVMWPKKKATAKRAGVLVIHGGGWVQQVKERNIAGFCIPYLERGFVVANVEYRTAKVATAPAAVTDALNAAHWFYENAAKYGVDRKHIVVTGESAGAHLAMMVGMVPDSANLGPATQVAAVIDVYGVTNVSDQLSGPRSKWYAKEWIPDQPGRARLAERLSPLNYVRQELPPILIIHGDQDEVVPYDQAVSLAKRLRDVSADFELVTVPNGKHGFTIAQWRDVLAQTFSFLERRGIRGTPSSVTSER